jgi:hypothetical protein
MKKISSVKNKCIILVFVLILGWGFCGLVVFNGKTLGKTFLKTFSTTYSQRQNALGWVDDLVAGVDSAVVDNVYQKEAYIEWYGFIQRLVGRKYIRDVDTSNTIVKDNDGKLHFLAYQNNATSTVNRIAEIKSNLEARDVPVIVVQTPIKIIEGYTEIPPSMLEFSNENSDNLLASLQEKDIDFIDLREVAKTDGLDLTTLFFDTDHHWTTETAFWAVQKVVDKLRQDYGIDLDPDKYYTDLENYRQTVYEQVFLGSQGRRVGQYYAGLDDYTLITPQFDTDYRLTIKKSETSVSEKEGNFEKVILDQSLLDMSATVYTNRYAAYFGADYAEVILENKTAANDQKVLIIKDSFALPFTAFLSTMPKETRMLDLRYFDSKKLDAYIEEMAPDVVLFVSKFVSIPQSS